MKKTELLALKVDAYKAIRDQRLDLQKEVDALETQERALKTELISLLEDSGVQSIGGKLATVALTAKTVPVVQDWDAVYAYVKKHNAFDLLHRRITVDAVKARWDNGHEVPGVSSTTIHDLSVRKAK